MDSLNGWTAGTCLLPEQAQLLRGVGRHLDVMRTTHRWVPFPQESCSFAFGAKGRPLPVGALIALWEGSAAFTTACQRCGGTVYVYSWAGLLSIGSLFGVCAACGQSHGQHIGGLAAAAALVQPVLHQTEFALAAAQFGSATIGKRLPLCKTLAALGERDLPSSQWARARQEPGVRHTMRHAE
jgi:hypothetical protein